MKITVSVTQEDIERGREGGFIAQNCPIARALRRARFPDATVGLQFLGDFPDYVVHFQKGGRFRSLPESAQQFAFEFDIGRSVEPFSFELEVPE